jgi:hypothetical protein
VLEGVEGAFDDVTAAVGLGVVAVWASAFAAASLAMPGLVGGFGDDRDDAAAAKKTSVAAGGVRLVRDHAIGSGAGPTAAPARDAERSENVREHRAVTALPGAQQHHQRTAPAIAGVVDLGGQPAPGSADGVVNRLNVENLVIPQRPPCPATSWWRADAPG